ncbi:MAG: glycosyltransferase [Actinomycetales bacterium]|nr:glycosyltransferase [Actinomycetales bacterium]
MTADYLHRSVSPLQGARRGLARPVRSLRLGMLSTYPPTVCGLATFASALERGLRSLGHRVDMIGIDDGTLDSPTFGLSVAGVLRQGSHRSAMRTAATLNQCDAAIIQHEYGIYGGEDGAEVLEVLRELEVPSVVVLHTVPVRPSPNQASILVRLCAMADLVVVMTECAGRRLMDQYPVDRSKVIEIAHGALVGEWSDETGALVGEWSSPQTGEPDPTRLLSWGLLSPGKGVERVIDAIGTLARQGMPVQYTVAGRTHPKVAARQGETYRASLIERAHANGIAHLIEFDQAYRDPEQLTRFIGTFSAVVMAYDSHDQVTSGVLVDSVAAGRPVIATAFPHAVEVLAGGAGIVVPHDDQQALTQAIETVIADPEQRRQMTRRARQAAADLSWTSIAGQYARACAALAQQRVAASW